MPMVKLGRSRQVVIPKKIHDRLGLASGDYLEVELKDNQVVLTPKMLVDKHPEIEARLREAEEDVKAGRVYGPFRSVKEMTRSLHKGMERSGKKSKKAS
jgi:AbrB family looped-hinge helix DNA binding protein